MWCRWRLIVTLPLAFLFVWAIVFAAYPLIPGNLIAQWMPTLKSPHKNCSQKVSWLTDLNLTYPIHYARREIRLKPVSGLPRRLITNIDEPLFPEAQTLDFSQDNTFELRQCKEPLELEIAAKDTNRTDASHIIFGLSTTLGGLEASVPQLLRWLPKTHARLLVVVVDSDQSISSKRAAKSSNGTSEQKGKLESKMRNRGLSVTLFDPLDNSDSASARYLSLLKIMYEHRSEKTKWLGLLEDKTFLPSIPSLLSMLANYNPEAEYYIGGLSEDWWFVTHYGLMAFSGAGIFISIKLAEKVNTNYQICVNESQAHRGDVRVMECIYAVSRTKLSFEIELHPMDIGGDHSGVYESGTMPLSVYHWDSGDEFSPGYNLPKMHLVADVCGDCFLQRWQFGQDMILVNGFSVSSYPKGSLKHLDLKRKEETWRLVDHVEDSNNAAIEQSLAPVREKLDLQQEKLQYVLLDATVSDGGLRQFYFRPGKDDEVGSLLELVWLGTV